jgi:hypothetical protein
VAPPPGRLAQRKPMSSCDASLAESGWNTYHRAPLQNVTTRGAGPPKPFGRRGDAPTRHGQGVAAPSESLAERFASERSGTRLRYACRIDGGAEPGSGPNSGRAMYTLGSRGRGWVTGGAGASTGVGNSGELADVATATLGSAGTTARFGRKSLIIARSRGSARTAG